MITERFAEWAVEQRKHPLTDDVADAAIRAVADWFASAVPGSAMSPAKTLVEAFVSDEENGPAQILGDRRGTTAVMAALINGTASHSAELDDIYREGIYHPGAPTIAAALAVGEATGSSGERFLRAVAIGYEIGDRIAKAVNPSHYRYWHTTGTIGSLGAAAASAEIMRLDAEPFAHALALSATMAAGLQQSFRSDSMSKPLHAGHAAQSGVIAGYAARSGFTGALDVLEGEAGFGAAMTTGTDWDAAVRDLGVPVLVGSTTVKNHSCCGHTFAAIDAALELRDRGLVPLSEIASIEVETYSTALTVAGNLRPKTAFEAKFSIPYCVAAAIVFGSVRLRAFEADALVDPNIERLMLATSLSVADDLDAQFPARRGARLRMVTRDGAQFSVERQTRKGDPDDPLTEYELRSKFREFLSPAYGSHVDEIENAIWNLMRAEDLAGLRPGAHK